ncbi:hypothetical protein IT397_00510 [Candidatus Nomurabacteria bacterium]|nr:hypothetical protein [Candidatus Nomurabacteria bacterium]
MIITGANGQTINVSCGNSVYVNDNNNYYYSGYNYNYNNYNNGYYYSGYNGYYNSYGYADVTCYPEQYSVGLNQPVRWIASVSGNLNYYNYSWSGSEDLYSTSQSAYKSYSTPGTKYAYLRVYGNGVDRTVSCSTLNVGNTGSVFLLNGANQGNLASLSSVYLNQVPYTGVGDNLKTIGFISLITVMSLAIAYLIFRKQYKLSRTKAIENFKLANLRGRN